MTNDTLTTISDIKPKKDTRFKKGNKIAKGRIKGSRNKATIIIQERGDEIIHEAMNNIDEAIKNKDMDRTEFLVKLLYGNSKQSFIEVIGMPNIDNLIDLNYAANLVVTAIGKGEVSLEDGKAYLDILDKRIKGIEATDIEMRLRELEGNAMRRTILHEDTE